MVIDKSPLSRVCKSFADYLGGELGELDANIHVLLGSPANAASADQDIQHSVNLFFFRFEPSGFGADTSPGETQYLRTHCLITPFASDEGGVSSGENDLRIIGEVLRIIHERPVFDLLVDEQHFHLQVMFQTLGMDQINQIWSTQGDTIYRPSLLFEVSLAPIIPKKPRAEAPRVAAVGLGVSGQPDHPKPAQSAPAQSIHLRPDTRAEDWAPALVLIHENELAQSLNFARGSEALNDFHPQAWIAGEPETEITLCWDRWDAEHGWQRDSQSDTKIIKERELSAQSLAQATTYATELPSVSAAGQLLLYAEREYQRGSDGHTLVRRSNPVLINLYEEAP